jgi:quinate dehydrogenase (quinone)
MKTTEKPQPQGGWLLRLFGVVLALVGVALALGGLRLVTLGGSWYYLLAGVATLVAGVLLFRRKPLGGLLYLLVVIATVIWALAEVGTSFWGLVPRLAPVLVLGFFAALCLRALSPTTRRTGGLAAIAQAVVLVVGGFSVFTPHDTIENVGAKGQTPVRDLTPVKDAASGANEWLQYGRDGDSARYAPFDQINKDNVNKLEVAWTFRTGSKTGSNYEDQNTPIHKGDSLYLCTPENRVIALNAETGEKRWEWNPNVKEAAFWNRCRGVAYYEMPTELKSADGSCDARIITTTKDAKLWALDAKTGAVCQSFGKDGATDLSVGLGAYEEHYYMPTSQPFVVGDRVVIGGWVWDGKRTKEPSGVVRAFDLKTGELSWAWDLGNPAITKLPPEGETYTKGTPNWWSSGAYDAKLNLIYLPLGNGTPDFWGGHRSKETDEFTSAVVALHADTGRLAWKYRAIHNDTWDYDIGTPPALVDLPDGKGGETPALVVATKTHQLFMLDRRTGEPVAQVEERPVSQEALPGDRTSPTQPYSVGMPQLTKMDLKESDMWGATMFDQLACRITFKQLRNEGAYTKLTDKPTLINPGYYGGFNWGGMAVDKARNLLIVNDMHMPQIGWLMPQDKMAEAQAEAKKLGAGAGVQVQAGTPYVAIRGAFNSPLGIPCHQPSWGNLTAIDLTTKTIAWQVPMGTVEDSVVNGVRAKLPVPIGMPSLSGPIATAGNLIFHVGTQDYYIRAYDTLTGKEVWKDRLPVGAQATPMTYLSPESGRQFVVTVAGGARMTADRGDYVIAYALRK